MTYNELLAIFDNEYLSVQTQTARDMFEDDPSTTSDARRLDLLFECSAEIADMLEFPRETVSAAYTTESTTITLATAATRIVGDDIQVGAYRLTRRPMVEVIAARQFLSYPCHFAFDARESETAIQIAGAAPATSGTYIVQVQRAIDTTLLAGSDDVWDDLFIPKQRIIADYAAITAWSKASLYGTAKLYSERFMTRFSEFARQLGKDDAISMMHDRINQLLEVGGVSATQGSA